ncbi:putative 30S ribosomal protein S31, mitochondrial precursor [Corchorus capsularis]|uniref:Putative 30S ribosomal protein S31, mitochondrial n=1 Tax=Corchorus capsularis TaxID=210143 RepID=A0A1R3GBR9_COCAP|nr:putative 30S ribosomal protein S31, mitochondrial precursor [Corchorus capsularis]
MAMMQWCAAVAKRVMTGQQPSLTSASPSGAAAMGAPVLCGRGDKKTKKGKIFKGPYGNARPKKEKMIERIKDKVEVPRCPWPLPFKLI